METTTEKMKKELSMDQILSNYIKHKNGSIFQVISHKKPQFVWLRAKNKYTAFEKRVISQGLVDGNWLAINEHEWRKWVKTDNEYIEKMTQRLVKRILLTQLLIELDDELIEDYEDVPQFKKLLERTNKESERIAVKNYDRLYAVDKSILQKLMNSIDGITSAMSKCEIDEFIHLENIINAFIEKRDDFKDVPVLIDKLD